MYDTKIRVTSLNLNDAYSQRHLCENPEMKCLNQK